MTILAIILIISLVGWGLSTTTGHNAFRSRQPIPDNVPPAAGDPVPGIDVHAAGRTSDKLGFWADPIAADTNIPPAALRAYGNAVLIAAESWPSCHLNWTTLAGIGYVETRHGTYSGKLFGGSEINDEGWVQPPIFGIPLDGSAGVAKITDSDGGKLDGDSEYDRAMGPMQFIPQSWERYGRDANGDGSADPQQIDDAALGAANLLCNGHDLSVPEEWVDAIHSYNMSNEYLIKVRNAAANYALRQPA